MKMVTGKQKIMKNLWKNDKRIKWKGKRENVMIRGRRKKRRGKTKKKSGVDEDKKRKREIGR